MLERAEIADSVIVAAVGDDYGIGVGELDFLPLGADSATWVYRLRSLEGGDYLVKLRAGAGFGSVSLLVPHYLQQQGVGHLIAPLETTAGALWTAVGDFVLTVYPFVEGGVGARVGLSQEQWREFGVLMRQVHDCQLPAELRAQAPRERFVPGGRELLPRLDEALRKQTSANEEERELALFWRVQQALIHAVAERADVLGRRLAESRQAHILCHGDMHPWNILLDESGELWLVDWDEVVIALKERDLMFAIGGIGGDGVGPQQTEWFLQGYGPAQIDEEALAYYRCAWAVQDIVEFAREVILAPEQSEASRRAALEGFKGLFSDGAIVERGLEL